MKGELTYRVFDLVTRRRVVPTLQLLLERQGWSRTQIEEDAARRSSLMLDHARRRVPFYRDRTKPHGDPDLSSFPLVAKEDLRGDHRFLADDADLSGMRTTSSGGSTGAPVTLRFDRSALDAQTAAVLRHQMWMGLDLVCHHLLLWSPPAGVVTYGTLSGRLKGLLLRRRFVHTFALDQERAARLRARLRRTCPPLVVGYSSVLDLLAAGAEPLPHPPRAVVAAAEILYPAQRRRIERFFGARVYERYGCNEFATLAHQCARGALHINSDRVVLEVLRPDGSQAGAGEIGEAVVTDLDNFGMPLIRYRLGDALELGGKCACPLPFPTIGSIHGRMADLLPGAGGRPVSARQVSMALEGSGEILEHQVRVSSGRPREVRLRAPAGVDLDAAARALQGLFGEPVAVTRADQLERWPSGKVRPVVRDKVS